MSQQMYSIILNCIYIILGISSVVMIFMVAFMMRGKGNGLSAISNSNLSLFENIKSYGIEKGMQKVCAIFTILMFVAIIAYPIVLKVGVK